MTSPLPLFPLGTVLFPGLVMPLHVFEERYRALVRHLMSLPDGTPKEFGVVAIRRGWEVDLGNPATGGSRRDPATGGSPRGTATGGSPRDPATGGSPPDAVTLYDVGCSAEVRQITEHPDGRFDLVTVGRTPFEITRIIPADTPYLQAEVRYLPEPATPGAAADLLGPQVLALFRAYLRLVRTDAGEIAEQLPEDPTVLSHLVAATAALTLGDRQDLLAIPDTAGRLRAELGILRREVGLLREIRAVPVTPGDLPVKPGPN